MTFQKGDELTSSRYRHAERYYFETYVTKLCQTDCVLRAEQGSAKWYQLSSSMEWMLVPPKFEVGKKYKFLNDKLLPTTTIYEVVSTKFKRVVVWCHTGDGIGYTDSFEYRDRDQFEEVE